MSEYMKVSCGTCDGHIAYPAVSAGQTVACPHCSKDVFLPYQNNKNTGGKLEAKWTTTCIHCHGKLEFSATDAGKQVACKFCGKETTLSHNPAAPHLSASSPSKFRKQIALAFWVSMFGFVGLGILSIVELSLKDGRAAVPWGITFCVCFVAYCVCPFAALWASGRISHAGERLVAIIIAFVFLAACIYEFDCLFAQLDASASARYSTIGSVCCGICFIFFVIFLFTALMGNLKASFKLVGSFIGVLAILSGTISLIMIGVVFVTKSRNNDSTANTSPPGQVSQSILDGSVSQVKDWLKANANDPSSLQYVDWKLSKMGNGNFDVVVQYRAKNGFGALMLCRGDFVLNPDGTILRAYPDLQNPPN
jgi:hypothetical protein